MADMREFGTMNPADRGGSHDHVYEDGRTVTATPGPTPSQTIGPFFAFGLTPGPYGYALRDMHSNDLTGPAIAGERILLEGEVFDGSGVPVHDAMVELLQADSVGAYADQVRNDGFTGYGRCGTGAMGPVEAGGDTRFRFHTIRPGATAPGNCPFVTLVLTMRGLLNHCITRVYFPEDAPHHDPVLGAVPKERRRTLIAGAAERGHYRFDIHMQGENETVFFDV